MGSPSGVPTAEEERDGSLGASTAQRAQQHLLGPTAAETRRLQRAAPYAVAVLFWAGAAWSWTLFGGIICSQLMKSYSLPHT